MTEMLNEKSKDRILLRMVKDKDDDSSVLKPIWPKLFGDQSMLNTP